MGDEGGIVTCPENLQRVAAGGGEETGSAGGGFEKCGMEGEAGIEGNGAGRGDGGEEGELFGAQYRRAEGALAGE
jgi:hypothetical protein